MLTLISFLEALQAHWWSPIYTFFKPDIEFQYLKNWPCHFFTCTASKCKTLVGIVFRTQRTSCLLPTSSIMLYGALEQTLSTMLSLVRNLSNVTSQSLPCLPARANNQSGIHIMFTWTQKSGKKSFKLFYRTAIPPTTNLLIMHFAFHISHSTCQSLNHTQPPFLTHFSNSITCTDVEHATSLL